MKSLRIYILTVGVPALLLACAGVRLVQLEARHAGRPQIERRQADVRCPPDMRRLPPQARRRMPRVFREDEIGDSLAYERMLWIGGCVIGLLFLSLVSGGWLLFRSARAAREDALRKTDFLSNVSHEFKTPLTTICLCAELAQDEGLDPARRRKALASIMSEAERLKSLVLSALDFSRLERRRREFRSERADIAALAREAAEPMRERFSANGLALPGDGEAAEAEVDVAAFRQVVVILLDNAAKYAAAGGPVEVSVSPAEGRRTASLVVADRGPGLDKAGLRHAFDRFWRGDDATTAETGGSGLGLAIARELAHGMHGGLAVAPRPGGGLAFTLTVPAAKAVKA